MEKINIHVLRKGCFLILSMLAFTNIVNAQVKKSDSYEQLWQSFLTPPDSIRVGCYYYWVNEQVDPKGVVADLQWMKDNGITLAFLATDIRNRTRWEKPISEPPVVEEPAYGTEDGRKVGHRDGHLQLSWLESVGGTVGET